MTEQLYFENYQGLTSWNIPRNFWVGRKPGLSAMMRIKNEGQFLRYAVASIIDWHDEVCLFIQGEQADDTEAVADECEQRWPDKVRVFHYPWESLWNGPGHENQPRGSVHERAYFYNWCLAQTSHEFANKWDGDMIAHEWLGPRVRSLMQTKDSIWFKGNDLFGVDLSQESGLAGTATEERVYRVGPNTFYFTFTHCEHFSATRLDPCKFQKFEKLDRYGFIHLKWCKRELAFSGVGWPENWMDADPYYRDIYYKKKGVRKYRGPYPPAIMPYLDEVKLKRAIGA